jgi:hypothetical protein
MEPEGSLLHVQVSATCPYHEGAQYIPSKYLDKHFPKFWTWNKFQLSNYLWKNLCFFGPSFIKKIGAMRSVSNTIVIKIHTCSITNYGQIC